MIWLISSGIYRPYVEFTFRAFKQSKQQWNNQPTSNHACQRHILGKWATNADKSSLSDQVDMTGIWQEYTCHTSASASAALLGACLVSQTLFAVAPPCPLADLLRFSNRETGNTRLGPSKVPQPAVDLIHMAASDSFTIYLFYLWLMQIMSTSTTYDLSMQYLWLAYILNTCNLLMIYLWSTYYTYDLLMRIMFSIFYL